MPGDSRRRDPPKSSARKSPVNKGLDTLAKRAQGGNALLMLNSLCVAMKLLTLLGGALGFGIGLICSRVHENSWPYCLWHAALAAYAGGWLMVGGPRLAAKLEGFGPGTGRPFRAALAAPPYPNLLNHECTLCELRVPGTIPPRNPPRAAGCLAPLRPLRSGQRAGNSWSSSICRWSERWSGGWP